MKFTYLGGDGDGTCTDGRTCPSFYATDRETYVVQGGLLSPEDLATLQVPAGESAVEIPATLVEVIRRAHTG